MTTDTKAAERLAERLAAMTRCPPGESERLGCGTAPDPDGCLDARAAACWLAWSRRDDERTETGGGRR